MATKKRSPKTSSNRKSSSTKKRRTGPGKKGRGGASPFFEALRAAFSREAAGILLLGLGLFFTAAFFSGRGAFLGEVGETLLTRLFGVVGIFVAPLAAVAGALILMRRLEARRATGAALILAAVVATFAAPLPGPLRFDVASYAEAGGLIGSGIYHAVYWTAGFVGAVLVLGAAYLVGLSLLTGVTFRTAYKYVSEKASASIGGLKSSRERREAGAGKPRGISSEGNPPRHVEKPKETIPYEPATGDNGWNPEESGFELVLPGPVEAVGFDDPPEPAPGDYTPPSPSLLKLGSGTPGHDAEEISRRLTRALSDFGVEAQVSRAVVGPRVTRYELRLGSGVKVGKVRNLQQDIAYALAATEVRILAPIPGKSAVGVEVPNTRPATVTLGDAFQEYNGVNDMALPVGLGKDISGRAVFLDLAEMPHLLVAGTTGSGKSVMLNSLLTSLLLTTDPRRVKMVLVDPKRVELAPFGRIPHLITPVVTDVKKAANALSWAVAEMERRYEVLEREGVRSLEVYNERVETPMPYVVVVIDELADLMMAAAAKVEDAVIRLAQKARAVGMHLVVATQRPSVDVITGMIKANIPSRIAFAVSSQVDSRVILDAPGAESLLGMGDMLYKPVSASRPSRVQGAFISDKEVDDVVSACAGGFEPRFIEEVTEPKADPKKDEEPDDDLLSEAASFVVSTQQASVSAVQRRFRVGYSRAGRIIDSLERKGIVGPYEGSKSRSVSASEFDLATIFGDGEEAPGPDDHADGHKEDKRDGPW
ncbi:MAG: DNA translocase FtsK 4TM domain-containing protein [Rubrobacteraceae bacterium]